MTPLHAEIPYSLGRGWLKKEAHLKQRSRFLDFTQFCRKKFLPPPNKTTTCWAVISTEQGTSKSTSLPKPTADEASLVTTWIVSLLKLLAMAVGCVNQANAAPSEKQCSSPINATVCVGRLLCWILLCWMWQVALAWHWESDHHGAPSCVIEILCASENNVIRWGFCSTMLRRNCVLPMWRQSWWLCDLWSKLNQEPRSCGK